MEIKTHVLTNPQNLSEERKLQARKNIDLGNVENTSDMDKPVSTAQQAAIDALGTTVDGKLAGKVDKEAGKGLSTNDFDDTYKSKVEASYEVHHTHTNKSELDQLTGNAIASAETTDEGKTLVLHPIEGEAVTFSGEQNAINTISQNGVTLPIDNKNVEITETIQSISKNGFPLVPDANHNVDITIESPVTPYEETPEMNGTGSAGSSALYSRGDHVHPSDTTKADKDSDAVEDDLAKFDSNGNPVDSGIAVSELSKLHEHENKSILDNTTASYTVDDKDKLDNIAEGATKVEESATNGNVIIDGTETTVYTHPTTEATAAAAVKVGKDSEGHVVLGDPLTKSDVGLGHVDDTADMDKPVSHATATALNGKVDKVQGKDLSTNDYSNADKDKLTGIEAGAQVNKIETIKVNGTAQTITDKAVDIDLSGYKQTQQAVVDPTVGSDPTTEFIATISQDANGVMTATKQRVQDGTTEQQGIVQLEDAVDSTSTSKAATPNSVKRAYDLADSKQDALEFDGTYDADTNKVALKSTVTSAIGALNAEVESDDGTNVQVKVTEVNGVITGVNVTTDNTINASNIAGKADKVSEATEGNFAGLDANGNLTDSGSKADDFATAAQGSKADTALQGIILNGDTVTPEDNIVDLGDLKTKQTAVPDPQQGGNTSTFEFIDSLSQNENGVINPTKKKIPLAAPASAFGETDGLMSKADKAKLDTVESGAEKNIIVAVKVAGVALPVDQTDRFVNIPLATVGDQSQQIDGVIGVVKLTDSLDNTDPSTAITPTAVKAALNAQAEFINSQAEWEQYKQAHPTGDLSKTYFVQNSLGADHYDVYRWDGSTYRLVDQATIQLTGYWHDGPTAAGVQDGNVVTDLTLGSDGVPVLTKGTLGDGVLTITVGSAASLTFGANQTTDSSLTIPLAQSASENPETHEQIPATEGLMSASDKAKLDSMTSGAEPNAIDHVKMEGESGDLAIDASKRVTIPLVTTSSTGLMTGSDKTKLDGIEAGAEENVIESISVNGTAQTITSKNVDLDIGDATIKIDVGGAATGETNPTVGQFSTNQQAAAQDVVLTIPAAVSETDDGNGNTIPAQPGVMSAEDKKALDNLKNSVTDVTLADMSDPLPVIDNEVNIPLATKTTVEGSTVYTPGIVTGQERETIQTLKNFSKVTISDGATPTPATVDCVPRTASDTLTLVAGNNVTLTKSQTSNTVTIASTGGTTVSGGRGISVVGTQSASGTDYNVSVDGSVGYYGSVATFNNVSVSPMDLLDADAVPFVNSENDRFVVATRDGNVYLYALKTIHDASDPTNDVAGVDVFTLAFNVQIERTPAHGFYGMAGVQLVRDASTTTVLHSSTESYPSSVGKCSVNGTATVWNNAGTTTTISGKEYYGYRLLYTGDASVSGSDLIDIVARFSVVENMSGTAEYTGTMSSYTAGDGITIDANNAISANIGDGLKLEANTNKIIVNVKQGGGLKIEPDSGGLMAVVLDDVTEEVVETVTQLTDDMDSKLTTNFPYPMITEVSYDFGSLNVNGSCICQLFSVPFRHPIEANNTYITVYAKDSGYSQTNVMFGIYEYDPAGNNGTGDTRFVCDTGAVSLHKSQSNSVLEFPIVHVDPVHNALYPNCMYYAVLALPPNAGNGIFLAAAPNYNAPVNSMPTLNWRITNCNGIDWDHPSNASLDRDQVPWSSSGYNEHNSMYRFFMQIRNHTSQNNGN